MLALAYALSATPAVADEPWTFCVGWAGDVKDVWISEVFSTTIDRERLEASYKDYVEHRGAAQVVAQCPLANVDETVVVNARNHAEEFNRKLGATLHAVSAQEFPPTLN